MVALADSGVSTSAPAGSAVVPPVDLRSPGAQACIWAGVAGSTMIVAGGLMVGPQAASHGSVLRGAGFSASFAGIVVLVGAWLCLGRVLVRLPGASRWVVYTALVAWALPLLCSPPLFSRDIFSYAAHGREIVRGINPYRFGPSALGGDPYLRFVSPTWSKAKSPYGPFFLGLDGLIVRLAGGHALVAVALLRLVSFAGVVLLAGALARLASTHGTDAAGAVWLGVLNPLMLLHVMSGGHNEGLMVGLMVAGLALAAQARFTTGIILAVLATGVKAPAAVGVVYIAGSWISSCSGRAAKVRATVRATATVVATTLTLTAAVGLGWGWLSTITTPTRIRTTLSPANDIGLITGTVLSGVARIPGEWALFVARLAGLLVAVAVAGAIWLTRRRRPPAVGAGLTLLAVAVFGPVVQPWYLLWGLVPLAVACPERLRPALIWISAGLCLLVLPDGSAAPDAVMVSFVAMTAVVAVMSGRGRAETGSPPSLPAAV